MAAGYDNYECLGALPRPGSPGRRLFPEPQGRKSERCLWSLAPENETARHEALFGSTLRIVGNGSVEMTLAESAIYVSETGRVSEKGSRNRRARGGCQKHWGEHPACRKITGITQETLADLIGTSTDRPCHRDGDGQSLTADGCRSRQCRRTASQGDR